MELLSGTNYYWFGYRRTGSLESIFPLFYMVILAFSTDARHNPSVSNSECRETDFSECLKSFDTIIMRKELGFAATETELDLACKHLKAGVRCIDGFVKRCTRDRAQQDSLSGSVKGAFEILELLCDDTYHRKEYLDHAECYRKIAGEIEECMSPMREMGLRKQNHEMPQKSKVDQIVCCAYDNATQCIHKVARSECNERAATFLKNYTDRAAYPITQQCRSFNSKVCSTASEKSSSSPHICAGTANWLIVPVLTVAYIVLL